MHVTAVPSAPSFAAPNRLVSGTVAAPASAEEEADVANHVAGVTDPRIAKEGNTYYLFSSNPGITLESSTDLVHWQPAGQIFTTTPSWVVATVPGANSLWAPDISYFGGLYHLYYAVSEFGTNRSAIGLATSPTLDPASPDYHWTDQGEVIASRPGKTNWNAIDPAVAFDASGAPWLTFGSQWSGIKLVPLDPATGKLLSGGTQAPLISLAARSANKPIEAPYIVAHGGYYYLFVSFDHCCMGAASTYKIMAGRSTQITGPYLDESGKPMLQGGGTLVLAGDGHDQGPGHSQVFVDGNQDWLVYHAYDVLEGGIPRLRIRPLGWSSTGWPVIGPPLP